MYADDVQIYTHSTPENLVNSIQTINNNLLAISNWSNCFGLKVNPVKSQVIIIGSPGMVSRVDYIHLPPIVYNDTFLPYCTTVKNLGVHLDQNMSWSVHINNVSRKIFHAIGSLRRLRSMLPIPTKIMLANTLLLPILDYADASYPNLTEDYLNKLERLQNLAIRFIFNLRKYDHVSEFRSKLKWLPIRSRRNLHTLSLLYCVLHNEKSPPYLKEMFEFLGAHTNKLRSSENLALRIPRHSSRFYEHSFAVRATKLWNDLPLNIRRSISLSIFKKSVKNHYLMDDSP